MHWCSYSILIHRLFPRKTSFKTSYDFFVIYFQNFFFNINFMRSVCSFFFFLYRCCIFISFCLFNHTLFRCLLFFFSYWTRFQQMNVDSFDESSSISVYLIWKKKEKIIYFSWIGHTLIHNEVQRLWLKCLCVHILLWWLCLNVFHAFWIAFYATYVYIYVLGFY